MEEEGEKGIRSGENITKRMKNRTIDGISGKRYSTSQYIENKQYAHST